MENRHVTIQIQIVFCSDKSEHLLKKRVKFSAEVEYDWQSLDDNEVSNVASAIFMAPS